MKSFKLFVEEWMTAVGDLSIYKNPSQTEIGKACREGDFNKNWVRFLLDGRTKTVYVANANLLHFNFLNSLPDYRFKKNEETLFNHIFTGLGYYTDGKITKVQSDAFQYSTYDEPRYKILKNNLKIDYSFADRYFDKPVNSIIKKFLKE